MTRIRSVRARLLLLGGVPFEERILMWWNFVARDMSEIRAAREAWAAAEELEGTFIQVNVADEDQVNHLFDETVRLHGRVDIAFNNAGISPPDDDSIETTELPAWQKVQDVNLKSVQDTGLNLSSKLLRLAQHVH